MNSDDSNVLSALLAVADERSFTRAAKRLGVTQSALSHSIRALEERLGVRLLARTTRSVAPTDAGAELVAHIGPAIADIRGALEKLAGLRDKATGRVRLVAPRLAAKTIVGPKLGEFARQYPDIVLDITTDDSRIDLVAGGYDAASIWRVHRAGHGRRACVGRPSAGDRRVTAVLQVTSKAEIASRSACSPMHQLSAWVGGRVPLGVR